MLIIRRCGDNYTDHLTVAARLAMLQNILARRPQFVVYNRDDPVSGAVTHLAGQDGTISFGTHKKAECQITAVTLHPQGSAATLRVDHQTDLMLATALPGKQAIYSATAAAAAGYVMRTPIDAIETGVINTLVQDGQLEYLPVERPYQIVIDAAATPGGLAENLETAKHFAKNRLIVVLGASLGVFPAWLPLMGEIAARAADRLIVTDGEYTPDRSAMSIREQLLGAVTGKGEAKTEEIPHRKAAIEKAVSIARRGDVVFIACTTLRPYRQLGDERVTWSDRSVVAQLLKA